MQSESEVPFPRRMLPIKVMGTKDDSIIVAVMHFDMNAGKSEVS